MPKAGNQPIRDSGFSLSNDSNVSTDALLDRLSHPVRRNVLTYRHDEDDDVGELAELAGWVLARDTNDSDNQQEAVEISFHHTRLPKLATSGAIDSTSRSNPVRSHGQTELGQQTALVDERVGDVS
ncbi:DUF7344 domain-containing protein [Halorussus aquaticus]|uniref:DUF7344 domain-containing protein n=1 Tax=Halorussus aquaticus TaxID=2953748 RepID=UPI003F634E24